MICIKCKEKIPILSNLDFEKGTILLYCQCDNENKEYNINDYIKELNEIKNNENNNIKNQKCFIHKNNDIELFCIHCSKELCYDCDLKIHQKENHQLCKLNSFFEMIEKNIKYNNITNELCYFSKINQKFINEIIKFIEYVYQSFYEQKNKNEMNFTPLKNICYIELRLFEYDSNNKNTVINTNNKDNKPEKNIPKFNFDQKINNIRHYCSIKKVDLKNAKKSNSISFFNILLIPNSYYCILISPEYKILIINVNNNEIMADYALNPKINSSIYNLCLLNEEIFSLIYTSGSFDLFFIQKIKENKKEEKINLIRRKYIFPEKTTNIINQIKLAKEKNELIILMNNKLKFFRYNFNDNNKNISLINEIERNDLTLFIDLKYNNSILSLFNNNEIVIKDQVINKNYIIKIKNINFIYEIETMKYLAISHFDDIIDIFDMNLMIMKAKLIGHKKIINDIKELIPLNNSNYKSKLISCSDDNTIRIWDLFRFECDLVISLENQGLLYKINILPNKEIMALTNDNSIYIIE